MDIITSIRNTSWGNLLHLIYWYYRGQYELKYNDYDFICRMYRKLGRELNLVSPRRYTEKQQWLKLFYRNDKMPICSDKYMIREYLKSIGYDYLLNDLIAVYENVDAFNPNDLPDSFVLKASHGSGWNLITKNKSKVNWFWWKRIMRSWMKQNLYWFGREWNYKEQKPRIIVEKYLEDDSGELRDFKIFCFNGTPHYIQVDENRSTNHKRVYWDCEGNVVDFGDSQDHNGTIKAVFNDKHRQMIELAKELSKPFPNVRVDFYLCNDKIYLGEMTFFGGSGFYTFEPDETDYIWGGLLKLPEPNYNLELFSKVHMGKM